ncbi:hypothetical protein M0R45_022656 [Rubus argutus]|uniref:Snakin-2 n=1 Tax=Rubus argutus TaxID=59490 RepID=A0AAW1XGB7_RUBAR
MQVCVLLLVRLRCLAGAGFGLAVLLEIQAVAATTKCRRALLLVAAVLVFCILQVSADGTKVEDHESPLAVVKGANRRVLPDLNIDCDGLCKARCSLHSRPNRCNRACGTCCVRCKCVPPGTAGNREVCGTCYTDMTTHGNRLKCP